MRCPKCGTENRDSAKFCDECGFELPTVAPYAFEMFSQSGSAAKPGTVSAASASQGASDSILTGDASEDEFAALFNDSGTVKLTHIAEKLRKTDEPEVPAQTADDAPASDDRSDDDPIAIAMQDALSDEDPFDDSSIPTADLVDDDLDSMDLLAEQDPYKRDPYLGLDDDLYPEDDVDELDEDDLYSVDTAPLSTADVNQAVEDDDQSTMLASAAAMAAIARSQQEHAQSPASTLDMPVVPSNSAPKDAHSFLAFSSNRNRRFSKRFKTGFVISLCVIAAAIAILGITYALQLWGGKTIPDVLGASSADAKYLLEESGFFVEEKLIVSDDVEGIVIEVSPEPGSRQPLGSTVTIGVSTFRVIPSVVGMQLEEAQNLLSENGYTDVELVMKKSDEDEGSVLGVSPDVGTRADADTHVTLEVAQPYLVPDVVGDSREEAINVLAAEGFEAEILYDYSETDPEGSVMRTVPAAGDPCKTTTPVQIVIAVSRATELGNLTSALFDGVDTLTYGGNMYQYVKGSFATASCPDNNTCNFTIRARLLDMHTWPDGRTDTWVGDEVTISSSAGWSDSNEFLYMDPNLLA